MTGGHLNDVLPESSPAAPYATHESDRAAGRPTISLGLAAGICAALLVVATTISSWLLAVGGRHDGRLALGIATAALVVAGVATRDGLPRVEVVGKEVAGALLVATVTAFFVLPAFPYAYVEKDPGVYAAHGFSIARTGDVEIEDPALEAGLGPTLRPGLWVEPDAPDVVTPQFFHAFPSLLATAQDLGGRTALFSVPPLLGLLAVLSIFVAARLVFGDAVGVLAGLLLGTSMMQVWQARTPGSEIHVQALLAGALLAAVLALRSRWRVAGGAAGVLVATTYLVRPDGFVYLLLAGAALGIAVLFQGWQSHWRWFAAGFLSVAPLTWWNAYDLRSFYAEGNEVPGPVVTAAFAFLPTIVATLVRPLWERRHVTRHIVWVADRSGWPIVILTVLTLTFFWFRPDILGEHMPTHPVTGEVFRSYDEQALRWISWFLPVVGLATMVIGWAWVLTHRPFRVERLVLVAPGLLLLPLYLWDARIASRLMWWARRFVPLVLPTMLLLVAVGLVWLLTRRSWAIRIPSIALAGYLLFFGASQSYSLRAHSELEGSWEMGENVAATAETPDTVFIFDGQRSGVVAPNRNLPGAVWLIHGHLAYRMSADGGWREVQAYAETLGRPVHLVLESTTLPTDYPADRFEKVAQLDERVELYEETPAHRPRSGRTFDYDLGVWRFIG